MENWRRFVNEGREEPPMWWMDQWGKFTDNLRRNHPDVYNSGVIEDAIANARSQNLEQGSQPYWISVLKFVREQYPEEYEASKAGTDLSGNFVASPSAAPEQPTPEPEIESGGDFQILSPVIAASEDGFRGRQFIVVKTPSYGNVAFYKSTGEGSGEGSKGLWVPTSGVGQLTDGDDDIHVSKMLSTHPEACSDASIASCVDDEGALVPGKMPNPNGEFGQVSEFINQNLPNTISTEEYIRSGKAPSLRGKHFARRFGKDKPLTSMIGYNLSKSNNISEAWEAAVINYLLQKYGAQFNLPSFSDKAGNNNYYGIKTFRTRKRMYYKFGEGE